MLVVLLLTPFLKVAEYYKNKFEALEYVTKNEREAIENDTDWINRLKNSRICLGGGFEYNEEIIKHWFRPLMHSTRMDKRTNLVPMFSFSSNKGGKKRSISSTEHYMDQSTDLRFSYYHSNYYIITNNRLMKSSKIKPDVVDINQICLLSEIRFCRREKEVYKARGPPHITRIFEHGTLDGIAVYYRRKGKEERIHLVPPEKEMDSILGLFSRFREG